MKQVAFEELVRQAVATLPEPLLERIENVEIVVRPRPSRVQREEFEASDADLLGLYVGTPLDCRAFGPGIALPDRIYLFQAAIERAAGNDWEAVRREIRDTLLHEIAHHFGFSEREVEAWEREEE